MQPGGKILEFFAYRSFVRDADSDSATAAITTAVISMAQGLGLKVIAEGVDLEAQAVFLNEQGCDEMQGFLFSGPVTAEDFEQFLYPVDPPASERPFGPRGPAARARSARRFFR